MSPLDLATMEQPAPKTNNYQPCFVKAVEWLQGKNCDPLIEAICARAELGAERYGTYLQPYNGRNPAIDLLQEILDALVYTIHMWYTAMKKNLPTERIERRFYGLARIGLELLEEAQYFDELNS